MTTSNALTCSVVLLAALACGSEDPAAGDAMVVADAAADADVDADADGGLAFCPQAQASCEPSGPNYLRLLLEAATYGVDAAFAAADGDYVLIRRATAPDLLVRALLTFAATNPIGTEVAELPTGFEAIDVGETSGGAYVVACDASTCRLFRYAAYEPGLLAVDGSDIALTFEPRGLVLGLMADADGARLPCVYGRGVICFTGAEWQTELVDEPVRALTMGVPQVVLTAEGRALVRTATNAEWVPVVGIASTNAQWVDNQHPDGAGFLSDPETWTTIDSSGRARLCHLGEPYAALRSAADFSSMFGLSVAGFATFLDSPSQCRAFPLALDSVMDLTVETCGDSTNQRLLTREVLWGTVYCAIE